MEKEILRIARRIQALSQAGLKYSQNEFDTERYQELRELSTILMSKISDVPVGIIRDLFTNETGFQTPKVDIRAVVVKDGEVLLAREKADNRWSLPGGFADVNYSPSAIAVKEVREETGVEVKPNRLLAVVDTDRHNFPPLEYHYYKIVILCDYIKGTPSGSIETYESAFFDFDHLPELSVQRNTKEFFDLIRTQLTVTDVYID